jgi:adenylate cyclase
LFVIARNSVFTYKGKPVQVQRVAEELGIRYVLEGSIQRSGERLRTTVQLIDATSGHHLWSERFDRQMGDLFALQDEIALKTTIELQVKLTGARQAFAHSATTNDIRAWLDYVKGQPYYDKFTTQGHTRARELWTSAVERDPKFADAWISLGWIHWNDARFRRSADSKASLRAAEEMADKAAALAPGNPRLALLRGQIYLFRDEFDRALSQLRRAIELSPSDATALAVMGQTLFYAGQYDESIRLTERAMRLNPFYPSWFLLNLGRALLFKGEHNRAIEAAERGLARAEGRMMTEAHRVTLAMAYVESGDLGAARQAMNEVREQLPDLSIAKYAERYRFRDPAHWKRFADILRAAGLPDGASQ